MLLAAAHPGSTFSVFCGALRIMYAWQERLTSVATAALKPRIEAMPGKGRPVRSRMACDPVGRAAPCMGRPYRPTGPDRWLVARWAELVLQPETSCRSNAKKCLPGSRSCFTCNCIDTHKHTHTCKRTNKYLCVCIHTYQCIDILPSPRRRHVKNKCCTAVWGLMARDPVGRARASVPD